MKQRTRQMAVMGMAVGAGVAVALVLAVTLLGDRGVAAEMGHEHHPMGAMSLGTGPSDGQPTFYSEMSDANARMHAAMDVPPTGDIDRDFMRMMIPHHQGAVDMARLLLKYGQDPRLKRLAQSIIVEQDQEIAYMQSLLARPAEESAAHPKSNP